MQLADVSPAELVQLAEVLASTVAALVPLRLALRSYFREVPLYCWTLDEERRGRTGRRG